jgi:hypothetical protein
MELWRDGLLLFSAAGDKFLCRSDDRIPGRPLRINTLVLAESTLLFCKLAREVYSVALPRPRIIQFSIEFRNLTNDALNPTILPAEVDALPWPDSRIYAAEYAGERFTLMADYDEDPAVVAWRLVSEVYLWFGIELAEIPYSIRGENGARMIDEKKIASLPRR